jgi:hypothetical protein
MDRTIYHIGCFVSSHKAILDKVLCETKDSYKDMVPLQLSHSIEKD